jgi:hypothetical protein
MAYFIAEVCNAAASMTKGVDDYCTVFNKRAQHLCYSYGESDVHRHNLHSCGAMSKIFLQRGKEKAMCIVHVRVHCSDRLSEMLVGDVEQTELTIESIVGTALLEVFDTVHVENVTVHHYPERNDGDGEQG